MNRVSTIGIDLAKNVFQLHGVDKFGKVVFKRKLKRAHLMPFLANLPQCLIGLEACGGSNYWARQIQKLGHNVKIMSPQFVKPYVKNDKTDENDAEAICEAVTRPRMQFVPIKQVEQQDIQCLHRVRSRLVKSRTALINEIRGLLHEYGVIIPKGIRNFRKDIHFVLEDAESDLTFTTRDIIQNLITEFLELENRITLYEQKIQIVFDQSEAAQRVAKIPGIGVLTATALVAAVSDARAFKNGRQFAAWLGLVPKQRSSGGKQVMLGISKRGDAYLRRMLIHGARTCMRWIKEDSSDYRRKWAYKLKERRSYNCATVAWANKNARMAWALIAKNEEYKAIA